MRSPFVSGVALTLVALPAIVIACSSDAPEAALSGPEGEAGPAAPDGRVNPEEASSPSDAAEAASFPQAKGNPCRGVPLPAAQRFVPAGMCAHVVASGLGPIRQISFAPNGDLFGVTLGGAVLRLRDHDGDGFFQPSEVSTYAETGGNGNNGHIDAAQGYLYAGAPDGVKRWPYGPTATSGGAGEDVVIGQSSEGGHPRHTTHVYDGYLYVSSGSSENTSDPKSPDYDDDRALIRRFSLASFKPGQPFAWLSGEVVTRGLRNANGFTKNAAGRMYAVVNGIDGVSHGGEDVHEDNPGEQVVEIAMGRQYGFPYCWTAQRVVLPGGQLVPPGTQLNHAGTHTDAWCAANSSPPSTFIQAHSAPLDLAFFDTHPKGGLPERYRGGAFVALHGSWNRSRATGYQIVWIPFDAAGKAPMPTSTATATTFPYEVVLGGGSASGPQDGAWSWAVDGYSDEPRFAGVAISPIDGALYMTSDNQGLVYRVGVPN